MRENGMSTRTDRRRTNTGTVTNTKNRYMNRYKNTNKNTNLRVINNRNTNGRTARREPILSIPTIIAVFTLLLIIGGVLLGSSWSDARKTNAANEYPVQKYYTSIEIQAEDTLWSIADAYMNEECGDKSSYIAEIKRLNHIDEDEIHSGQHLLIPYYSSESL